MNNCFRDNFLSKIITLLLSKRNTNDIFELLVIESTKLLCDENQLIHNKIEPLLIFTISNDVKNLYKEYPNILLDKYELTVSSFYKAFEDCFYISFKINFETTVNIPILSVYSEVELQNYQINPQKNTFYINKNKSYSTIFKLNNFSRIVKLPVDCSKAQINFRVYLKINYTQTIILNYICANFYRYCNKPSISLLPLRILETILKNNYLILESKDQVIIALMHWSKI